MESGADNSAEQVTAKVTKELDETAENLKRTSWWKEENWSRMKKALENWRKPVVNGVSDEACLGLSKYPVPWSTVVNCLKGIGNKPIEKKTTSL